MLVCRLTMGKLNCTKGDPKAGERVMAGEFDSTCGTRCLEAAKFAQSPCCSSLRAPDPPKACSVSWSFMTQTSVTRNTSSFTSGSTARTSRAALSCELQRAVVSYW